MIGTCVLEKKIAVQQLIIGLFILVSFTNLIEAAPKADLWVRWQKDNPENTQKINHRLWNEFLSDEIDTSHPSGVYRVNYGAISAMNKEKLKQYLEEMEAIKITQFNLKEQKAYWINLYNALTVNLILDHYPVKSIKDITFGFFSFHPWDEKLVTVEDEKLSLNDIEHRILRPIWKDNRVHYAVNCASIGCPNLQPEAYTSDNLDDLLEKGAQMYVNHPRGARFVGNKLIISSIYDWFKEDFGRNDQEVLQHLSKFADEKLSQKLKNYKGDIEYEYDWQLNEP